MPRASRRSSPDPRLRQHVRESSLRYHIAKRTIALTIPVAGIAYAKTVKEKLSRFSTVQECANMSSSTGSQSSDTVGGDESLRRLKSVKQRWDPTNVFWSNHNVKLDD
jgi:hypothetical protein